LQLRVIGGATLVRVSRHLVLEPFFMRKVWARFWLKFLFYDDDSGLIIFENTLYEIIKISPLFADDLHQW